jgi:general L-amino acid transport system permease protein
MTDLTHGHPEAPRSYDVGQHPDLPPPVGTSGVIGWLRKNLFSSILSSILTLAALYCIYLLVSWALNWIVLDSVVSGDDQTLCRLAGSLNEFESNARQVNWDALQPPPANLNEADLARYTADQEQAAKYVGRAASAFSTFNVRLNETATLTPAQSEMVGEQVQGLKAVADRVDSGGLSTALDKAVADKDWAQARPLIEDARPLVEWGQTYGGACWTVVKVRFNQLLFYRYPADQQWRPILTGALLLIALAPLLFKVPGRRYLILFTYLFPIVAFFLLTGFDDILPVVPTGAWGGLMVTIITGAVGIAASLPIGILLALGRRSHMPVVRFLSIAFIEAVRGVPLITLLFMASNMLQLWLPPNVSFDGLLRALIVVALFASAYMAEVIRGGLQAIPKGQYEAAQALGLSYWKMMRLIVLPQALKITLPGIVNTFIGLFKDTTLLLTIGIFDFLGAAQSVVTDAKWKGLAHELYVFLAIIYFIFCFSMSRYSLYLERKLHTGHKRR